MPVVVGAVPNWNVDFVVAACGAPKAGGAAAGAANIGPVAGAPDVAAPKAGVLKVVAAVFAVEAPNTGVVEPKPPALAPNGIALADVLVAVFAAPNTKPPPPPPNPGDRMKYISVHAQVAFTVFIRREYLYALKKNEF